MLNSRVTAVHLCSTAIVTRLTEHHDVIKSLLRGAPRPGLALDPASPRAGPGTSYWTIYHSFETILEWKLSTDWNPWLQLSMQIHCFKKHSIWYELYFIKWLIAEGSSGSNWWARVKRVRSQENTYLRKSFFYSGHLRGVSRLDGAWGKKYVSSKVARRPWAPRTFLEFAIKTGYVLWFLKKIFLCLKIFRRLWKFLNSSEIVHYWTTDCIEQTRIKIK